MTTFYQSLRGKIRTQYRQCREMDREKKDTMDRKRGEKINKTKLKKGEKINKTRGSAHRAQTSAKVAHFIP